MKKQTAAAFAALIVLGACDREINTVSRPLLGTIVNLTAVCDRETAARATQKAFDEIARIEALMSPYREGSDISKIARSHGPVMVSPETFALVSQSVEISRLTGGAFDISFASVARLWNYKNPGFIPPSDVALDRARGLVDYRKITLDEKALTVRLAPGMKIGLGGIAKGYAVKRAVEVLMAEGVDSGIAEEGGDLQVFGSKNGGPWITGLMHPREKNLVLSIELGHLDSVATSGDYERYAEYEGKRYGHIINPLTGRPAEGMASVSVFSKDPVVSDAYATAFFVMGARKTAEFLESHHDLGLAVILIDSDMKMFASAGLKDKITFLEKWPVVEWIDRR